ASVLAQDQIQGPAAANMGSRPAQVCQQLGGVAAGVLQGVGQDGQLLQAVILVGVGRQAQHVGGQPGRGDCHRPERVPSSTNFSHKRGKRFLRSSSSFQAAPAGAFASVASCPGISSAPSPVFSCQTRAATYPNPSKEQTCPFSTALARLSGFCSAF